MINLKYQMRVISSTSEIEKEITKGLVNFVKKQYGESVEDRANHLAAKAQEIVRRKIEDSKTYQDLIDGQLWHELGLPAKIVMWVSTGMIDAIVQGITAEISVVGTDPIEFNISLNWDNNIILQTGFAQYVSVNRFGEHHSVDWLDWLLEGGGATLVDGYHIVYDDSFKGSRTGGVLMKKEGSWNIPNQYQGTSSDNFITRAIAEAIPEIVGIV